MVLSSVLGFSGDIGRAVPFHPSAINSSRSRAWVLFNLGWEYIALRFQFYRLYILNNQYLKISVQVLVLFAKVSLLVTEPSRKGLWAFTLNLEVLLMFWKGFTVWASFCDGVMDSILPPFWKVEETIVLKSICMSLAINGCIYSVYILCIFKMDHFLKEFLNCWLVIRLIHPMLNSVLWLLVYLCGTFSD